MLVEDNRNSLWAISDKGLAQFEADQWRLISAHAFVGLRGTCPPLCGIDPENGIWFRGADRSIIVAREKKTVLYPEITDAIDAEFANFDSPIRQYPVNVKLWCLLDSDTVVTADKVRKRGRWRILRPLATLSETKVVGLWAQPEEGIYFFTEFGVVWKTPTTITDNELVNCK